MITISKYEAIEVTMGLYKHHQGSSSSISGYSWIKEIRRAWNLDKDDHIDCAAAGCPNNTATHEFDGCHLAESILKEALSLIGIGGTPVVALCKSCHNKTGAAIMIGNTGIGIIDSECPADLLPASTIIEDYVHILCESCGTMDTIGPDQNELWLCTTCLHHFDYDGICNTVSCTSEWCHSGKNGCKKNCNNTPLPLCSNALCGNCCNGEECLRHSEHPKYGRPGWEELGNRTRKRFGGSSKAWENGGRQRYENQKEFLMKKFRDGPLRNAEPICRSCKLLLDTSNDSQWKCINNLCSENQIGPKKRKRKRSRNTSKKSHQRHIKTDYSEENNSNYSNSYQKGRSGFSASCDACGYVAVGSDIQLEFGFRRSKPFPRCRDCRRARNYA